MLFLVNGNHWGRRDRITSNHLLYFIIINIGTDTNIYFKTTNLTLFLSNLTVFNIHLSDSHTVLAHNSDTLIALYIYPCLSVSINGISSILISSNLNKWNLTLFLELISISEEPDVRTRKIVKVVTQTMVNGKVVDESSEVEQIEETKK